MKLSTSQTWEILELTFVNRDDDDTLTDEITIHIYDNDPDLFLQVKGYSKNNSEKTINFISETLKLEEIDFPNKEDNSRYFSLPTYPNRETMRTAMRSTIPKMESIGMKLRELVDTWV